jgi:hypothetical protein
LHGTAGAGLITYKMKLEQLYLGDVQREMLLAFHIPEDGILFPKGFFVL